MARNEYSDNRSFKGQQQGYVAAQIEYCWNIVNVSNVRRWKSCLVDGQNWKGEEIKGTFQSTL